MFRLFEESGLVAKGILSTPAFTMDRHVYNQYVIRVTQRDELRFQ